MESSGRTVTEHDLVSFASLTGDWHPQHADASWAAESPLARRTAPAMLVISYGLGLLPFDPQAAIAVRSIEGAELGCPVGLGDTICARATLVDLCPMDDDEGLAVLGVSIHNQDDEVVARMRIAMLWRREPSALGGGDAAVDAGLADDRSGPEVPADDLSPIQDGRVLA